MSDVIDPRQRAKVAEGRRTSRFRSPWLEQLHEVVIPSPLGRDVETDVAIVGAGIAGLATAFFLLRDTTDRVILVERGRAGCGASGRNAGQLVTYFERPLCDLVDAFGFDKATRAQAEIEFAWTLLDEIIEQAGIVIEVERFDGAMGMFSLNHLQVHLRNNRIRRDARLDQETIVVSSESEFLSDIPVEYRDLFAVVPPARIRQLLHTAEDKYTAVLINRKGCANSALLCQELLGYLKRWYPDRFEYADQTAVETIVLDERMATLTAGSQHVAAGRVILCTNGYRQPVIENRAGGPVQRAILSRIGFMAAFSTATRSPTSATSYIVNDLIGGKKPYYYGTRRPYVFAEHLMLTCLGGPERAIEDAASYSEFEDMPQDVLEEIDTFVRPTVSPERPAGLDYDYTWHGLMAYTEGKIRLCGVEPRNPLLMYNLGCNGVGFLPSIAGGFRISRLQRGERLEPSIFDPT